MVFYSPQILNYVVLNAFTKSNTGGNAAAAIFLDTVLPNNMLFDITRSINQPVTSFVFPCSGKSKAMSADGKVAIFGLRWFTKEVELSICGHGTLVAARALFSELRLVKPSVEVLKFETMRGFVIARRESDDRIEIQLPISDIFPVTDDEACRIRGILAKAFSKDDIGIKFIGSSKCMKDYVLIELNADEKLKDAIVDTAVMAETYPFVLNILTTVSSDPGVMWETRLFAPRVGIPEDQVCGSANCLLGPYWTRKNNVRPGTEMIAKQVSKRGGMLWVTVEDKEHIVKLKGELQLVAKGQLYLDAM